MSGADWAELGFWVLVSTLGGLVIFHGVAGALHWLYYVRRAEDPHAWKCQPERKLSPRLQRAAIKLSTYNLVVAGVLTGVLIYAVIRGMPTVVYWDVDDYGWPYLIASTVLLFVVEEALAYYVHRALHLPLLYKRFHRSHHRFVATTPYVTVAIHPVAFLGFQIASFLPLAIIPMHVGAIIVVFVYILVFNIVAHSGIHMKTRLLPFQAASAYHDDHHRYFHVNFGQHITLFDRLHKTLRREGRTYGKDVFGGQGAGDGADFVKY